jgi:type II secretory pathway component PulJ
MKHGARTRAYGLGLIEQMVAMLIGLFLVIGATSVFVKSRKSAALDDAIAQLQLKGRHAMQLIEADVRMANFWGLSKDGAMVLNKPEQPLIANPSITLLDGTEAADCGKQFTVDVERYIEATNNSYPLPTTCAARTGAATAADTLTIRRATRATGEINNKKIQLCSHRNYAEIIFGSVCDAEVHDLAVSFYYIDSQSQNDASYPSLRRKSLGVNSAGTGPGFEDNELISGVEDLQIQLGWDATGDTASATQYVNPEPLNLAAGQVVAARVWLLMRAQFPDTTYNNTQTYSYGDRVFTANDHFRRLLVSRTIYIRNAVGT